MMRRSVGGVARLLFGVFVVAGGCSGAEGEGAPASGEVTSGGSSGGTGDGGFGFVVEFDLGAVVPCDVFAQDCDEGFKCAAYDSDDDGVADDSRCVPLAEPPSGAVCYYYDPATGYDDCDLGWTCRSGRCVPNCIGTAAAPECADPSRHCVQIGGPLHLCLWPCTPGEGHCGLNGGCYPVDGWPRCMAEGSTERGQPCTEVNDCVDGLRCVPGQEVHDCIADRCCQALCDVDWPGTCGVGHQCQPVFDATDVPPEVADLGTCVAS